MTTGHLQRRAPLERLRKYFGRSLALDNMSLRWRRDGETELGMMIIQNISNITYILNTFEEKQNLLIKEEKA